MKFKLDIDHFDEAVKDYQESYKALDEVLYELPRLYPGHSTRSSINIKLNIIGKTYDTGIARAIKSKGGPGSSMTQLENHFWDNREFIEERFKELAGITAPLDPQKLEQIVKLHGLLMANIIKITRKGIRPRSFVSKYMHFHCPQVPIYDSFASEILCELVPWKDDLEIFELPKKADEWYWEYSLRFYELYNKIRKERKDATVKQVDCYLLWEASD
jgi:hypothetical protein